MRQKYTKEQGLIAIHERKSIGETNGKIAAGLGLTLKQVKQLNCTPIVRQCDILITIGVFSMPKGKTQNRYTPEFKKEVIETMLAEKLSCNETAERFEVSKDHRVRD